MKIKHKIYVTIKIQNHHTDLCSKKCFYSNPENQMCFLFNKYRREKLNNKQDHWIADIRLPVCKETFNA